MKGTVAIITNPHGTVVGSAVDCAGVDAAGFSEDSEQARRAKARAKMAFTKGHLNEWLASKVDSHDVNAFWDLAQRSGYSLMVIKIDSDD